MTANGMVEVTQADRERAAALIRAREEAAGRFPEDQTVADIHAEFIQQGEGDAEDVVQAFARHRIDAATGLNEPSRMCQFCQGSGCDQNRLNDPGPCPHCNGVGYIAQAEPPSPNSEDHP